MIAMLRGSVVTVTAGSTGAQNAVVEVGGIGYQVAIAPQHARALRPGTETLMHTALIVREDELSLYGFASRDELAVFDLLRGVTGVGPKSALGVLAAMSPHDVAAAVDSEDDAAFRRVSGIGPKTAKLIVLSLSGKLAAYATGAAPTAPASAGRAEALAALVSLGFPERRAEEALDAVADEAPGEGVSALVRRALASLGPAGAR